MRNYLHLKFESAVECLGVAFAVHVDEIRDVRNLLSDTAQETLINLNLPLVALLPIPVNVDLFLLTCRLVVHDDELALGIHPDIVHSSAENNASRLVMILDAPAQRVTPFFHSRVFEWHCIDLVGFHERVRISLGTVRVKLPLH